MGGSMFGVEETPTRPRSLRRRRPIVKRKVHSAGIVRGRAEGGGARDGESSRHHVAAVESARRSQGPAFAAIPRRRRRIAAPTRIDRTARRRHPGRAPRCKPRMRWRLRQRRCAHPAFAPAITDL